MAADERPFRGRVRPARRGTVRVRTTVAAAVVVGVSLVAGSVALVEILRHNLTDGVRDALELRAEELAAVLGSSGTPSDPAVGDPEDQAAQILDGDGKVVAASANLEGAPAMVLLRPGESAEIDSPIGAGRSLAVAVAADTTRGRFTVVVSSTLEDVIEPTRTVTRLLLIGVPLLLVVVAATTWRVVGRALAPVDAIRAEVDEISASELHRRVPDPHSEDELARLARTMNRMLDRLEEAQARQRRFISDASHELRSPVASIRQHVEVALAHPDRTTIAELARTVLAEDLRVQRLVDDLLLLARADERTLVMNRRPVDLDDLVFDEARRLREATSLRIETSGVSAGRVLGDAAELARALRNLGDNAVRHARRRVAFGLGTRNGIVTLTVDDDGDGIPASERDRVFERFVRLDDARGRDDGGSGLGLAIVAELVRLHGGSVVAADSELGGARIEVTLPADASSAAFHPSQRA